jgi:hypothetical protein
MSALRRAFAFNPIPTTVLVVFIYAAALFGVLVTDGVRQIPEDTLGLDLEQGYEDLHQVSLQPNLALVTLNNSSDYCSPSPIQLARKRPRPLLHLFPPS